MTSAGLRAPSLLHTGVGCRGKWPYPHAARGFHLRNFLDTLTGRAWRMWCRNLVKGGEKTVQFVSENVNYHSPALPGEEIHLVELGTEITGEWAVLREQLLTTYVAGFSDKDIRDLKQEAIRSRTEAVGAASFVRFRNINRGVYKPYYDRFPLHG